jgi:O-antigen/teichoic acid export membrane protein
MGGGFYSATAARRSLVHFVGGKLISATVGIAYLLTTVRSMPVTDYGSYVAVMASTDMFYIVSGLGLSTVAQRYVAEYRVNAAAADFGSFLTRALQRRLLLSLAFATAVALLWTSLSSLAGLSLGPQWRWLLGLLLVGAAGVAFLDEVMGALLLQAYSQSLGVARGVCRLALVAGALLAGLGLTIDTVLYIETTVAVVSWVAAEIIIRRWARTAPSSSQARVNYAALRMSRVSLRFYLVQLMGQTYGPSMVKLLVTRLLGASQTATLGVAQSVTDMLRNYMPAHLLGSWIRPIMIARYVERHDVSELSSIANLVLKLNLLGMLPAAAIFVAMGDPLMAWLSAGRYTQVGALLAILSALIVVQSAHLLLGMITLTVEQPSVSLRATFAAAATLPLLLLSMLTLGLPGAALGMVVGEAMWVSVAWVLLRRRGFGLQFDAVGACKIAISATAGGVAGALSHSHFALPLWVALTALVVVYGAMLLILRPESQADLALVRRLLAKGAKSAATS